MSPKTFIVTGASKGIGLAVTQRLLSQGHNVVLSARSQDLLAKVKGDAQDGRVEYIAGDMTDPSVKTLSYLPICASYKPRNPDLTRP